MNQSKALAIMKAGKNVFLTGSAGAGKTYTLNEYIRYLKVRKIPVAITASTGIAATHLNGITIHAWSGIGVKSKIEHRDLLAMKEKKYLKSHLENVAVLIIDFNYHLSVILRKVIAISLPLCLLHGWKQSPKFAI